MSQSIQETLPELCRLLTAIKNEYGESWQITEGKRLLMDLKELTNAVKRYGGHAEGAKFYFEKEYIGADGKEIANRERDLRTYLLRSAVLGMVEPRTVRARLGYYKPTWTVKEAEERGQVVLVTGELVNNQETVQSLLFSDILSHILACINKRAPHDRSYPSALLAIDEVPMLLKVKGMASELAKISPQYRSRRLQVMIIIQGLWQLADELKEGIWSFGNKVIFGIDDHNEAYEIAKQLFSYNPVEIKEAADKQLVEADRGQYLSEANWIQNFNARTLLIKRYVGEGAQDRFVHYIKRNREKPTGTTRPLAEFKEELLKRRCIPIRDALEVVNNRKLSPQQSGPPSV